MPTVISSGTQAATVTTEHTLATDTTNKTYVLCVDAAALAEAATPDTLELRVYTIALAAGTERLAYFASFSGAQLDPIKYSPPIPANISCKVTLKQTAGTGRSFPWSLLSL